MNDQLSMFAPMTSEAIPNVISSPASADGPTLSASPDGPTIDLFGQAVVPASRSARPAKDKVLPTTGTYGRIGSVSSASVALQSSLASRLRQQLDGAGSTLFSETWKRKVTPRGRPYLEHTASARRTSGSECGSWPTPKTDEARRGGDPRRFKGDQSLNGRRSNLIDAAMTVASWPTPMAGTPAQKGYNEAGNNDSSRKTVALAPGPTSSGSLAATEKRGQLNPAFSRWLMGLPSGWDRAAPSQENRE